MLDEEGQSQALERIDEVLFWYDGVNSFNKAGGADVYANIMRGAKSDYRDWHTKLIKYAEETRLQPK
jgi:hypothetical protein